MADKVFHLAAPAIPDAVVIETLEQLLADAKSGALCAFTGVAEYHNGHVDHITTGEICDFATAGHLQAIAIDLLTGD